MFGKLKARLGIKLNIFALNIKLWWIKLKMKFTKSKGK